MIFEGVKLPDAVRIALENGSLVIFAGAGISMPPPSNLPSFAGLTREISGSDITSFGKEDQILGKLKRNGTNLKPLFTKSRSWGYGFMKAMVETKYYDRETWQSTFWAWREIIKEKDEWKEVLDVLEGLPDERVILAGIANLISTGIFKPEIKSDDKTVSRATALMDRAWNVCGKIEEAPDDSYHDWLTSALNHEGGSIGEFWVHYCSFLREKAGSDWKGIPQTLVSKIQDALKDFRQREVLAFWRG